jgi:phosphatidylglycerophosphate synthase
MKRKNKTKYNKADIDLLKESAVYPKLAKKSSDGMYAYVIQRRISLHITLFCVRNGISANAATLIDMLIAIIAALSLSQGYYILGVLMIQIFGLWSCVDGEIARLSKTSSRLGNFYDTMTDRTAEFLIFAGVLYSMPANTQGYIWGTLFFSYIGMVFLITASSEKFRSVYHKNYPKSDQERVFSWLCAGSDTRFLYLSLAIIAYILTGNVLIIAWFIITLTFLLGINFIFRMWKVAKLPEVNN